MIVTRITHGLGNQLFQYAAGRALAHRLGTDLALDPRMYLADKIRRFGLDPFAIDVKPVDPQSLPPSVHDRKMSHYLWRYLKWGRFKPAVERSLDYDPAFRDLPDNVYLKGYWQSERYFADIPDIIRRDLALKSPPSAQNARLIDDIRHRPSISLHIRRGDYVPNFPGMTVNNTLLLDYYAKGAEHLATELAIDPVFYVFSDDTDWARQNLRLPFETVFVVHNDNDTAPHEDLRLMSSCAHHIIANSTFSWWGAWLNPSPVKRVIAPAQWTRNPRDIKQDILPAGWTVL